MSAVDSEMNQVAPQPPECPKDAQRSEQALSKYCQEFARWLLVSNGSRRMSSDESDASFVSSSDNLSRKSPKCNLKLSGGIKTKNGPGRRRSADATAPSNPAASKKAASQRFHTSNSRKSRTVEDGTEIWMQGILDAGMKGIANFSEAIQLYRHSPDIGGRSQNDNQSSPESDAEQCAFYILRYPIPTTILSQFETLEELKIAFVHGMQQLMSKIIHVRSDSIFTLQSVQDKMGFRRKVPVPVIGFFCDYYVRVGYLSKEPSSDGTDTKITSMSKYARRPSQYPVLSSIDIARLAFSLSSP